MKLTIPIKPLSVNKCFQGRRFKTQDYLKYEKDIALLVPKRSISKNHKVNNDLAVNISFYINNYSRSDVDNFCKPLLDILTKLEYWKDDRQIKKLTLEKFKAERGEEFIRIEIIEYDQ